MKVLFLDFDGVLNSTTRARAGIPYHDLMPTALLWLRYLHKHRVCIVVSSTWRKSHTKSDLERYLTVPVLDVTPDLKHNAPRGHEIELWLRRHPGVERYAIIDDSSDMLPGQHPYFVLTDHDHGMQLDHFIAVCRVLTVPLPALQNAQYS